MPSYNSDLEEIKDRIDIVDLISDYVSLKKTGQNWKGLCPFHSEKTPSFVVSPAKQIYHCFGCGSGGDIFTFLMRYENLSFPETVKDLAERAGVTLQISRKDTVKTGEKETLLKLHKNALSFFQQALKRSSKAANYLKKRGIEIEAQKLFSLGYAPKSWSALLSYLQDKGYKTEVIKKAGLVSQGAKGYYDTFRDRIIFPIFDLRGDVIAFGGRVLDDSEPKYLNSPETLIFNKRRVLYGFNLAKDSIKKTGYTLFMEGYFDVITAHIYGFSNSVAPLGTAITQEQGKLIKRFMEDVILVFDSDHAGVKAAKSAANILLESGLNIKMLSLPDEGDPDTFLRKNGREAFNNLLKNPLSIIDFFMLQGGDKRLIAREAIETISKTPDRVLQGDYVKMLSEKLKINELFIIEELKRLTKKSRSGDRTGASIFQSKPRPVNEVYISILKLMLQFPEKAKIVSNIFSAEDFKDEVAGAIFKKINGGAADLNELLLQCEGEEKELLAKISFKEDFEDPEKAFDDCLKRLKDNKRRILLQELQDRIKEAELKKDNNLLKELLKQHKLLKMNFLTF